MKKKNKQKEQEKWWDSSFYLPLFFSPFILYRLSSYIHQPGLYSNLWPTIIFTFAERKASAEYELRMWKKNIWKNDVDDPTTFHHNYFHKDFQKWSLCTKRNYKTVNVMQKKKWKKENLGLMLLFWCIKLCAVNNQREKKRINGWKSTYLRIWNMKAFEWRINKNKSELREKEEKKMCILSKKNRHEIFSFKTHAKRLDFFNLHLCLSFTPTTL